VDTPAAIIVSTSVGTEPAARQIAEALVAEGLAACVHVSGPVTSIYRWRGAMERATEWTCHAKSTPDRADALVARIRALHSYEIPEILVTPAIGGDPDYLRWLTDDSLHP
jgi:periplasmic divalent cation tolerance protein